MKNSKTWFLLASLVTTFALSTANGSFLTLSESAEIVPEGNYRLGIAPQLRMSDGGGFNAGFYVDGFLHDAMNWRAMIGGGNTDFFAQGSIKWIPFPDYDRQPAMGGRATLFYARDSEVDFTGLQLAPMLSKNLSTEWGTMTPYVGLPISFISTKNSTVTALQLALGSELDLEKDRQIGAEFNLNLNDAVTSLTVYFTFSFDDSKGYKK